MLTAVAYFNDPSSPCAIGEDFDMANDLIRRLLGPEYLMDMRCLPDLILMAKDCNRRVAGLITLDYAAGTHAWEIGNLLIQDSYKRESLSRFLMDSACSFIRVKFGNEHRSWLVARVKLVDQRQRQWMKSIGFEHSELWMQNVLSDEGFVPFDPFDQLLMKRKVFV